MSQVYICGRSQEYVELYHNSPIRYQCVVLNESQGEYKARHTSLLGPLAELVSYSGPTFARKVCRSMPHVIIPTQEVNEIRLLGALV
jgi:hypothetical protein